MSISLVQHKEQITKRIVRSISLDQAPRSGFSAFFPAETNIEKMIGIEVERNKQLIAVDVLRGTDGNRNKFSYGVEKLFIPPYFNEKWDFTELERYNVTFGQRTNPSTADALNMIRMASRRIEMMRNKILRSIELMRSQVVQTGIVQLKNGDNVDFKRRATSMVTKTGADRWDQSGSTPLDDLDTAGKFFRNIGLSGGNTMNAIFGSEAYAAFRSNQQVKDHADFRRITRLELGMPQFDGVSGLTFQGQVGTDDFVVNLWTYAEQYEDPADSLRKNYLNTKSVVLIAQDFEGSTQYAGLPAIERDVNNAEYPAFITPVEADFYVNNWIDPEAKAHWFEIASAPLPVPYYIDRLYTLTVVS